jgi:hypothetical protein
LRVAAGATPVTPTGAGTVFPKFPASSEKSLPSIKPSPFKSPRAYVANEPPRPKLPARMAKSLPLTERSRFTSPARTKKFRT